ncbi:MAG TPA: hypothetical protein VEL28_20230 [Candidatus Binatia bacterium]|nr:hypothetical protein [Candidatus Binatia bacterium]
MRKRRRDGITKSWLGALWLGTTLLLAPARAEAEPSFSTAAIFSNLTGVTLAICHAFNVSSKPAEMTVEIVTDVDVVLASNGPATVEPGGRIVTFVASASNSFCRVKGLSEKKATATFAHVNGNTPVMWTSVP